MDSLASAARALGVPNVVVKSKQNLASDVLQMLIIVDNVASDRKVLDFLKVTRSSLHHILVTTRDTSPWQGFEEVPVDVFSDVQSIQFIYAFMEQTNVNVSKEEGEDVTWLAEQLGGLPLALTQACCVIVSNQSSFSEYKKSFIEEGELTRKELLETDIPGDIHRTSIFTTCLIALKAILDPRPSSGRLAIGCH